MSDVKIYTVMSDELSPPITGEAFCTDMVRASDYAALEQRLAAVVAENAGLIEQAEEVYAAGYNHGHLNTVDGIAYAPCVKDDFYGLAVGLMREAETPATDAYLAEVRASEAKHVYDSILDNPAVTDMESLVDWLEQYSNDSASFAAQLRQGAAL